MIAKMLKVLRRNSGALEFELAGQFSRLLLTAFGFRDADNFFPIVSC
jgi:hypothetical protein